MPQEVTYTGAGRFEDPESGNVWDAGETLEVNNADAKRLVEQHGDVFVEGVPKEEEKPEPVSPLDITEEEDEQEGSE